MPVEFLTNLQKRRYGRYDGPPNDEQLARYFFLDDTDLARIHRIQGHRNRLGFSVQLGTVRFLGTFLSNPLTVPGNVPHHMAVQLNFKRVPSLRGYAKGRSHWRHAEQIKRQYEYHDFTARGEGFRLVRWLYARAWISEERPSILFDLATAYLIERKVLLPGATTLARVVARVRERSARRLWQKLAALPSPEQTARLEALLEVPADARTSGFDHLRKGPDRISGPALVGALKRITSIRALDIHDLDVSGVPPNRLKSLRRYAIATHAPTLARMPKIRRVATLFAFAISGESIAVDDAMDVLDALISEIWRTAKLRGEKARLATLSKLDQAALCLRDASLPLLDDTVADEQVRATAFRSVSRKQLQEAVEIVASLARPKGDKYYTELTAEYPRVRRFLPTLLQTIHFQSTPDGEPLLRALAFLKEIEGQRNPEMTQAPRGVIPRSWRGRVIGKDNRVNRRAYTLCVLEQLQDRLRHRNLFVSPSERWGDPRRKLLHGEKWRALRPQVCRSLGHSESAEQALEQLARGLDEGYRRAMAEIPANADVRIERDNGHDRLVVTPLDQLEEPDSLVELKARVTTLLPRVDLPEAILEVATRTGFTEAFTHISERNARVSDLETSVCAVMTAHACNTGLTPVIHEDTAALTRRRLTWVDQNYFRMETIARANARLVNYQATLPLARQWGGGDVASADGLRFRTPVRTVHAGRNPKYFHRGRGVTYLNFMSDQLTGFHGIVVPGTLRDSLYILEGLLENQTDLTPKELMTDTAGASEIIFALFWILGYQFSPRLADIGGARFWRLDSHADYGLLNDLSRHQVHRERIIVHWDDFLRVAGSLKMGTISASELMRSLLRTKRPSSLALALRELGRIVKTIHHLNYITDPIYRRRTLTQLNHGESRHSVSREVFHGRRGELRKKYRDGQEEQLGTLGLVVNVLVLWNTIYTQSALDYLRNDPKVVVRPEDVARLSPLGYDNFNFQGRFSFRLPPPVSEGELRSLRDPRNI